MTNNKRLLLAFTKVKDHASFKDDAHVLTAGGVLRESFEMLVIVNLVNDEPSQA